MDGLAKMVMFVLVFFFLMGIYTALSPRFFTRLGKIQADESIELLETEVQQKNRELETSKRLVQQAKNSEEEAHKIARTEKNLREKIERIAREKELNLQQVSQELEEVNSILVSTQDELDAVKTEKLALQKQNLRNKQEVKELSVCLAEANLTISSQEDEIATLKPLAFSTIKAQRTVTVYRLVGSMVFISLILGYVFFYWWHNRKIQEMASHQTEGENISSIPHAVHNNHTEKERSNYLKAS